jgi:hypothetical protein
VSDTTPLFEIGETLRVKDDVPTWGGRYGEIVKVSVLGKGSIVLRIGVAEMWFDTWEVEQP